MNELSRRCFWFAAGALAGGGIGAAVRATGHDSPALLLRPPGARDEPAFLAACIRCGQCVSACPHDTLRLASLGFALVAPRVWCRALCPLGETYALAGRFAPYRVRVDLAEAGKIPRAVLRLGLRDPNRAAAAVSEEPIRPSSAEVTA